MKISALIAAVAVGMLATALAKPAGLPAGWLQTGEAKSTCQGSVAAAIGAPSAKVFNIDCSAGTRGFWTLMQQVAGTDYAGKRVRLSAMVHGEKVAGWGGVWMRSDNGERLGTAFDNMNDRPLKGDFGWQEAAVVLDIPVDTRSLSFGMLIEGTGRLQATRFKLEEVPESTPTTAKLGAQSLPRQANNLMPP